MSARLHIPNWLARSPRWLLSFVLATALCLLLLLANAWLSEFHPGNVWGLSYGVSGAVLLVGATLYAARRRTPARGPISSHSWLQFHVYGGALFLLLVLMHSGFRFPEGTLAWALWILSVWTVVSGILGILIQKWIPRLLTSGLATEAHYDRIGELVEAVRGKAAALVGSSDVMVQEFYERNLAPQLAAPEPRWIYFIDITGGIQSRVSQFRYLRDFLPSHERKGLDQLQALFVTKLELDAHYTLQRLLRWWLYAHVPFALMLVVLVGFHVFSILYY